MNNQLHVVGGFVRSVQIELIGVLRFQKGRENISIKTKISSRVREIVLETLSVKVIISTKVLVNAIDLASINVIVSVRVLEIPR